MIKAIWLEQEEKVTRASLEEIPEDALDAGDTTVRVEWSTLNFKDALAITGRSPIARKFPMIPGIDFAGTVERCDTGQWQPGDRVLLTGWGYGESMFGGLAQKARVQGEKLVRIPGNFDARAAMAVGTAGFTAMLCVLAVERHGVAPGAEVLVTGAGGGVGGCAVALLARRGYKVAAVTGRPAEAARLLSLGATEILERAAFSAPGKPLVKERWAAVVDSVGSHTLVNACASTRYGGIVAACGLAQGMDFPATVAPFILRGVTLAGIDSVSYPMPRRQEIWQRIADDLPASVLADLVSEIGLEDVIATASRLLDGQVSGRVVVRMSS